MLFFIVLLGKYKKYSLYFVAHLFIFRIKNITFATRYDDPVNHSSVFPVADALRQTDIPQSQQRDVLSG